MEALVFGASAVEIQIGVLAVGEGEEQLQNNSASS